MLSLATRIKPWLAFAAGSIAFTITTAVIVTLGSILLVFLPVYWIKLAGGVIMIGFAIYEFFEISKEANRLEKTEEVKVRESEGRGKWTLLLGAISMLVVLDLAGDATEVLTIVFVARFQDALLVFASCVSALVLASAAETAIGNRLGRILKPNRVRFLSLLVFSVIGSVIIITTLLFP